jgi:hypothetical protein
MVGGRIGAIPFWLRLMAEGIAPYLLYESCLKYDQKLDLKYFDQFLLFEVRRMIL